MVNNEYNLSLTINVPSVPSGSTQSFSVNITENSTTISSTTPFWNFENNYGGITNNTKTMLFSHSILFNAVQGTLKLGVNFEIPPNVVEHPGGISFPIYNLTLISITWGGVNEGNVIYSIIDTSIQQYLNYSSALNTKSIPTYYQGLVNQVKTEAFTLVSMGQYTQADTLMGDLVNYSYSLPPSPPSPLLSYIFIGTTIVGFGLAVVIFRAYSKQKEINKNKDKSINNTLDNLESLSVNIGKYDKNLSDNVNDTIKNLKKALK
ncbi:MAG: hypothetical protein QXZ12_08455 [Thermoplasmata archaeon]